MFAINGGVPSARRAQLFVAPVLLIVGALFTQAHAQNFVQVCDDPGAAARAPFANAQCNTFTPAAPADGEVVLTASSPTFNWSVTNWAVEDTLPATAWIWATDAGWTLKSQIAFPTAQAPSPVPPAGTGTVIRVNAGGQTYTDSAGNVWKADAGFNSGSSTVNWGAVPISGTNDPTLYQTERYGPNLQYTFALPNGTYQVNLHFAENWVNSTFPNGGIGFRVFSVQANGVTIVSNLDVFASVGAHAALIESKSVTVTNGQLVLSSPTAAGWFVDAVEVVGQTAASAAAPNSATVLAISEGGPGYTDSAGNVWTLVGGVVYLQAPGAQAAPAAYTAGVTLLEVVNGVIWQCNGSLWWSWVDGAWTPTSGTAVGPEGSTSGGSSSTATATSSALSSSGSSSSSGASGSSSSAAATISGAGGGSGGSSPTRVQVLLQGQDTPNNGGVAPLQPNHIWIGWESVAGASSYKIYRSSNPTGTSASPYSLYDTVSAASAESTYNTYLTASEAGGSASGNGGVPYQTHVDSAYQDTAATNAVGWPKGSPNSSNRGEYYNSLGAGGYDPIGYTYKVSAVVNGVEGALSSDSIIIYFAGGNRITNVDVFNGTINYADTTAPSASPLGFTTNALWNSVFINPFSGNGSNNQNLNIKGYNYMVLNVYVEQSGIDLTIGPEISGDQALLNGPDLSASPYYPSGSGSTLPTHQWVTVKVPISYFYIDENDSTYPNAQQYSFYKVTLGNHGTGPAPTWIEWYWSVN